MGRTSYAIALGSNRRSRHGSPAETVRAAADMLGLAPLSRIRATPALGPAGRSFANAVGLLRTGEDPLQLLSRLKTIEREFGRRGGRRWGPRVIDLDIILWSEGSFAEGGLTVPHPHFRSRLFVLEPLAEIAPGWHDPLTGLDSRQLLHRLRRPVPVDPERRRT